MPDPGFVPIRYRVAGWLLIAGGMICVLLKGAEPVIGGSQLPQELLYVGLALIVVGMYLTVVAARQT